MHIKGGRLEPEVGAECAAMGRTDCIGSGAPSLSRCHMWVSALREIERGGGEKKMQVVPYKDAQSL